MSRARKVKDYCINLRLKVSKKDLLWLLVLILPGGFLLMLVWFLATKRLKTKWLMQQKKAPTDAALPPDPNRKN